MPARRAASTARSSSANSIRASRRNTTPALVSVTPSARAQEQRHAESPLELRDLLAQRWLRDVQVLSGAPEAAESLEGIVIELTENELLADAPGLEAALAEVRERKGLVAIDDAGPVMPALSTSCGSAPTSSSSTARSSPVSSTMRAAPPLSRPSCAMGARPAPQDTLVGTLEATGPPSRPWSRLEIGSARIIAHQLGAALELLQGNAPQPTVEGDEAPRPAPQCDSDALRESTPPRSPREFDRLFSDCLHRSRRSKLHGPPRRVSGLEQVRPIPPRSPHHAVRPGAVGAMTLLRPHTRPHTKAAGRTAEPN